jgi:hypothetical protein
MSSMCHQYHAPAALLLSLQVKKYMRPQDIYVHAELHGAASCIVRNPSNRPGDVDTIPPASIEQAGQFTVCLSSAWAAQVVSNAWWVHASQVCRHGHCQLLISGSGEEVDMCSRICVGQ